MFCKLAALKKLKNGQQNIHDGVASQVNWQVRPAMFCKMGLHHGSSPINFSKSFENDSFWEDYWMAASYQGQINHCVGLISNKKLLVDLRCLFCYEVLLISV